MSQRACELLADARVAAYVGRGLLYPTACDGALKLLEVAYTPGPRLHSRGVPPRSGGGR